MTTRAVRTGLAALFTVTLGTTLQYSATGEASWSAWLLMVVYAASGLIILHSCWRDSQPPADGPVGRLSLLNLGAVVAGSFSLGLIWWGDGIWVVFVIGGIVLIGLTFIATLVTTPSSAPGDSVADSTPPWRRPLLCIAMETLYLAVILPFVGFLGMGGPPAGYPWGVSAALIVATLALEPTIHAHRFMLADATSETRKDRFVTLGVTFLMLCGVILAGRILPAPSEIRLLVISPAMVAAVVGLAAPLHPAPEGALKLATILVAFSYFALIGAFLLFYLGS